MRAPPAAGWVVAISLVATQVLSLWLARVTAVPRAAALRQGAPRPEAPQAEVLRPEATSVVAVPREQARTMQALEVQASIRVPVA